MAKTADKKKQRRSQKDEKSRIPVALLLVIAAVVLVLVGKSMLSQDPINPGDPAEVQLDKALKQKRVIYALFHSTDCIPCQQMEKTAAKVMPEFEGKITFIDVNVYDAANRALMQRVGLRVIPTNYIFDRSGQFKKIEGAIPADSLRAELNAALSR